MTVEIFDPRPGKDHGIQRAMAWLSGHVDFKRQHPDREAFVTDLEWYAHPLSPTDLPTVLPSSYHPTIILPSYLHLTVLS